MCVFFFCSFCSSIVGVRTERKSKFTFKLFYQLSTMLPRPARLSGTQSGLLPNAQPVYNMYIYFLQALKEHIDTCHPLKSDELHDLRLGHSIGAASPLSNAHHQNHLYHQSQQHPRLPSASSLSSIATSISAHIKEERGRSLSPCSRSDGSYGCSQCSLSFPNRDLLDKHELLHSPNTNVVSTHVCMAFMFFYLLNSNII